MIASGIALFMSTSIDSSYSSASEQTFAATSCDIFQVVRSEEPPTVPTKMELRCDGFEVVRTKHKTGFDECLKKLDEAREKLKKMESSKSTGLTYDSYALAHEREKERRKKDRMTRYKREKDHRMELKIQHYQNKLDDIKETSPGHNDARELLSNKMSRCKDKMNDISPMVSSSLSSENSHHKRVEQSPARKKRLSRSRSGSGQRNRSESNKPREEKSSSWFDSFLPFFSSASTNSTIHNSKKESERTAGGDHLKCNGIPRDVSVPTASIRRSHPKHDGSSRKERHIQDEAKEKQETALEIKAESVAKKTVVDSKHVANSRKRTHIQEQAKKKQGNEENVLTIKSVSEPKEAAVASNYVGKSRHEAHIQKQTKKKQRNEDHALSIKSASVENNVKEQKIEETWPILSVISHKEALSFYGSYYTTESASTSSKSFRLRRMPRENLKQKALELLANSSNNSSYSETTIEYEEVGKPATNSSLYDSNSSSNEKIAFMDMPKVDIIQRPPSENLCKAELVTDNFSEDVEEESLTTEVFT